jgi:dUTP pyrophosphatase
MRWFKGKPKLNVVRIDKEVPIPSRAHPDDAGWDMYAPEEIILAPGDRQVIELGVAVGIPKAHVGLLTGRSSLNQLGVTSALGVIDAGYTGEIKAVITNNSGRLFTIKRHTRIAQVIIVPIAVLSIAEVASLDNSSRGDNGFGSTGV